MEENIVKILETEYFSPDIKIFFIEKPKGYSFITRQATYLSINTPEFKHKKNPFSFTSLNEWPHLQFIIKIYEEGKGVTFGLSRLSIGAEIIIRKPWGAIVYHGP